MSRVVSRNPPSVGPSVAGSGAMVPMILDCDPGHDDAIAIVVAARHAELLGITTVAGNAPLDRTTHNALVMRELLGDRRAGALRRRAAAARRAAPGRRWSTARAASTAPTCPTPTPAARRARRRRVHRRDLPAGAKACGSSPSGRSPTSPSPCAPRPDLAGRIAGISLMGGGTFGNRSAVAEFNIWADPEAAAAVFGYGGPLVMAGLDVTHQLIATPERIERRARAPRTPRRARSPTCSRSSRGTYIARHDGICRGAGPRSVRGARPHPPRPVRRGRRATSPSRPPARSPAG